MGRGLAAVGALDLDDRLEDLFGCPRAVAIEGEQAVELAGDGA